MKFLIKTTGNPYTTKVYNADTMEEVKCSSVNINISPTECKTEISIIPDEVEIVSEFQKGSVVENDKKDSFLLYNSPKRIADRYDWWNKGEGVDHKTTGTHESKFKTTGIE